MMTPDKLKGVITRVGKTVLPSFTVRTWLIWPEQDPTPLGIAAEICVRDHFFTRHHFMGAELTDDMVTYNTAVRMVVTLVQHIIQDKAPYNGS